MIKAQEALFYLFSRGEAAKGTDYPGNRPQIVCRGGKGDETVPPPGNTADGGDGLSRKPSPGQSVGAAKGTKPSRRLGIPPMGGRIIPETVPGQSVGAAKGTNPSRRQGIPPMGGRIIPETVPRAVCRGGEGDEPVPPPGNTADRGTDYPGNRLSAPRR